GIERRYCFNEFLMNRIQPLKRSVHCNVQDLTKNDNYCRTKLKTITPVTFTGSPISDVGLNRAWSAAVTDGGCNSGCPDTAFASMTVPISSTVTWTATVP